MREGYGALWAFGGLIIGAWVGSRFNHGYPGGYAHGYPGNYGSGYNGYDRPCHEDKQDERIACLQAQIAAIGVSDKKNEEIDALRYRLGREITNGDIFKATCHKPDGKVFLPPTTLAEPYHSERNVIATYPEHRRYERDGRRDCDQGDWFGNCGNY